MPNYKSVRLSEDIKRELSVIIRGLKDPRLKSNMLSIVRTEVSSDLSVCKVFVSAIEGLEKSKEAVKGLESASGFIKREIMAHIKMKKCPELKFIPDNSSEYSVHINKILEEI